MKNVTLKDVAKAAGVSYATVSRALSGSNQIGKSTRERIVRLCDEMGYTGNYVARSMVMKKTYLLGLVVPAIENEFMSQLAYYVEMSARARGYNIMLCNSEPDLKQEEMVVKLLLGRRVDGILIVPQSPATYEKIAPLLEQIPAVFLSENLRDQPQSYVSVDNSRGAYLGVEYLYGLGHREILYFGCRNSTTHQLRAEGYLRACRQFGLEPRLHHSDFARSSIENGYQMVKELFAKPIDYTAIFASTDSNALGILKAADELHIRIPGDLSLIGFDNIPSTALPRIDLTTIEQPKKGNGRPGGGYAAGQDRKGDPGLCAPDFDAQPGPAGDLPFSDMMAERFFNLKSDRKNTVPGGVFSCGRGAGEKKMDCSNSRASQ